MRGQKSSKARYVGDTVDPNIKGVHFELGIVWPDGKGGFLKALSLKFEEDNEQALDSLKQLLVDMLTQVPEYLHQRVTIWRRKAGRISKARAAELSATEKNAMEANVLPLIWSRDRKTVRLVRSPYYQLSKKDRNDLTQDHLWARVICKLHSAFTANNASRGRNNAELRSDFPSPWHTFRLRSTYFDEFQNKHGTIGCYQDDMADSDRYWTLLFKVVVFLNQQFKDQGMFQIGEGIEFNNDSISKLEESSKFGPLQRVLSGFLASYPLPRSTSLEVQPGFQEEAEINNDENLQAGDETELLGSEQHHWELQQLREKNDMLQQRHDDLKAGMDQQQEELDLLRQRCEDLKADNAGLSQKCEDFRGFQQQYQADHEALQQGEVWLAQDRQQLEEGRAILRQGETSLAQERQQLEEQRVQRSQRLEEEHVQRSQRLEEEHLQRSQRLEEEHLQRSQRLEEGHAQRSRQLEEEHAARTMKFFSTVKVKLNELFVGINTAMPESARSSTGSDAASEHDGNVMSSSALTPEDVTQGGGSPTRGIKRSASDAGASPTPERLQRTRLSGPSPAPSE